MRMGDGERGRMYTAEIWVLHLSQLQIGGAEYKGQAFKCQGEQGRSVAQWCPTLCNPTDYSTPGLPVHHQLLEFTQTHIH